MSYCGKSSSPGRQVVSYLSALLVACASLLAAPVANAVDSGDIIVVDTKGEVHITVNGAEREIRAGGVLELPATLRTGRDGNIELKQGATTVSVGPESLLEFPALEKRGAPIDRILQPRGNAFYNIGKREGRKLRVETPYLVGVIKGTQFNVAVQDKAATISLFEGLLEVRPVGAGDVVELKAGEIASRKSGDNAIGVIKMDSGKAPPTGSSPSSGGESGGGSPGPTAPRVAPSNEGEDALLVDVGMSNPRADVDAPANVTADVRPTGVDLGTAVGVDLGPVAADVAANATADIPAGGLDVSTGAIVGAGPVTVDLGAGAIDTSASTGIAAGALTTDAAVDAGVDLSSGNVNADASVSVSAPLVEVDVGAAAGTVNVGLDVRGTDIDLGVNLGLDDGNNGHGNDIGPDPSNPGSSSDNRGHGNTDLGNLLDGLVHRSHKK